MDKKNTLNSPKLEIIIGVVSPIGTDKEIFKELLKSQFKIYGIDVIDILVTTALINIPSSLSIPKSLQYFLKMEICSGLRRTKANGILIETILNQIKKARKKTSNKKIVVYLVDQLKNVAEYKILSHIYGLNYVQMSLFSNEEERDKNLKEKFEGDVEQEKEHDEKALTSLISDKITIQGDSVKSFFSKSMINCWVQEYFNGILSDASHRLMLKDFIEIDPELLDKKSGQQVSDLFHRSHYFINLDRPKDHVKTELERFVNLLIGKNKEYPTQDEFGMCLAYQVSVRSNFPGGRHVGAAIISEQGEVISVASIRAPAKSSNPTLHDEYKVQPGYDKFYKKIEEWQKFINKLSKEKNSNKNDGKKYNKLDAVEIKKLKQISCFIKSILDFHPCTHAEISAIIDAAKLGVSVKDSTLYTTTFPCHLCAKDIINAGIARVVYLEEYPKSKNKELYPRLIGFGNTTKSEKVPFDFYFGIGPKRFLYGYSLENKMGKTLCPLLRFEFPKYYQSREKDILHHFENMSFNCKEKSSLCKLLGEPKKSS